MSSTKYMGLSYPTHFLKIRGSVIGMIFLNTEQNKSTFLRDEIFYTLIATNKAQHILYRNISCSCSDTIYSKRRLKEALHVYTLCVYMYEGHPINRETFIIMLESIPLKHRKCND